MQTARISPSNNRPAHQRAGLFPFALRSDARTYLLWASLAGLALAGSLIYGASLGLVFPHWAVAGAALWIALSAGLGWCVFLPALLVATRRRALDCIRACLVTIAYGEVVLVGGAIGNLLFAHFHGANPAIFNIACVALANATMSVAMTRQMDALRVPWWKTLSVWMVALNGSGALFFFFLRFLVEAHL